MSHPQWGITVLMTTHERPHLLRRALRSVLEQEQTDLPVHIVLVSDAVCAQTDAVASQCLRPQDTYFRRSGPAGPARSRNLAQQFVHTSHYVFLDDDDSWTPGYLQKLAPYLRAQPDTVFYTDVIWVTEEAGASELPTVSSTQTISLAGRQQEHLFYKNFLPNNCLVYPHGCARQHHTDETLKSQEDWEYVLSVAAVRALVHLPVAGVCVHKRGADTQHRGSSADAKNTHIVADYLHIYRKWPAPNPHIQQARQKLLAGVWPAVPPMPWF